MGFLKSLFGPPHINGLREKGNIPGLMNAVEYCDAAINARAREALTRLGSVATDPPRKIALFEKPFYREPDIGYFEELDWKPASHPLRPHSCGNE